MRRKFVVALGTSALAPRISWSQGAKRRPVVGVLRVNPRDTGETFLEPLRRELATLGWRENDNVEFAFAWAGGSADALPGLAAGLVKRGVDLILTFGPIGTRAAQKASSTIPIISMAEDLVGAGLVDNMGRPGGNTTGISILGTELNAKRLSILREATPGVHRYGALYEPSIATSLPAEQAAARNMKIELVLAPAQSPEPDRRCDRHAAQGEGGRGQRVRVANPERFPCAPDRRLRPGPGSGHLRMAGDRRAGRFAWLRTAYRRHLPPGH